MASSTAFRRSIAARPLRVASLVTEAFGGTGGIAQSARDLLAGLASFEEVERVDIYPRHCPEPARALPAKLFQHRARAGRVAYAVSASRLLLGKPDLLFCNHLYMAPLAALLAQSTGARLLVQLHGLETHQPLSRPQRRALRRADRVLCVSRDTRARALAAADLAPDRAVVLHNTVGAQFVPGDRAAARARFGFRAEKILLSVGRLDPGERYKGHDRIIGLLPALLAAHPELLYAIAGSGNDRSRLERLAREDGVADRVRFLGHVPREALPDLYRAADLFALPSTAEGFGIVFIEAMACGTPAIGLAVGGAPDALGDGTLGICVPESDFPVALATALTARPPDPHRLSADVHRRFGATAFRAHLAEILASPGGS